MKKLTNYFNIPKYRYHLISEKEWVILIHAYS